LIAKVAVVVPLKARVGVAQAERHALLAIAIAIDDALGLHIDSGEVDRLMVEVVFIDLAATYPVAVR
jgi:hypothetical protein